MGMIMILNSLEQLAADVDRLADGAGAAADIGSRAERLNDGLEETLEAIAARHRQIAERLALRRQLQAAVGFDKEMPTGVRQMLATDQQAFYRQLLGEMLQFFTGSEQGRCVSFGISVEELLFFIRLLLDEKVMDVGALKSIFLFLSRHAQTPGSEALSYESLRKKYSSVGRAPRERVQRLLVRLADRAGQDLPMG